MGAKVMKAQVHECLAPYCGIIDPKSTWLTQHRPRLCFLDKILNSTDTEV